jgi:hypothetical protein
MQSVLLTGSLNKPQINNNNNTFICLKYLTAGIKAIYKQALMKEKYINAEYVNRYGKRREINNNNS